MASRGTNRHHKGGPADSRSIAVCKKYGVDIESHIATRLSKADLEEYDLIFSMAGEVIDEMHEYLDIEPYQKKIINYLDVLKDGMDVPDPWYGPEEGFDFCYQLLDKATELWVKKLFPSDRKDLNK